MSTAQDFLALALALADRAAAETLPRFRSSLLRTDKGGDGRPYDPVTDADRAAERAMRALLASEVPEHGIIGEEYGAERADATFRWVLDPIDGTRAFVCGVPSWTTLIALEQEGQPVLSVIDQPFTGERWVGTPEGSMRMATGGAVVGGAGKLAVSCVRTLGEARISCTDPRRDSAFTRDEADAFAQLASSCQVARFSLDAYAYGLLAEGQLELVVEAPLQHYDYAALVPVVRGAGGLITGWRGEPLATSPRGRVLAAATPELHAAALKLLGRVAPPQGPTPK